MEKIIFFGTDEFAVPALGVLAKEFDIPLIVTMPPKPVGRKQITESSPVETEAKKLGLPVIAPEKFTSEIIEKIKWLSPDFYIITDYGKIIPKKMLDIPPQGAINVHPSELPKYRGASPLQTAIFNGEKETAFSVMLVDNLIDHGPILAQKKVEIFPDDTYGSLYKRLSELYPEFLIETLKKYLSGKIKPAPQNDSRATFTKILAREDGKIDWLKSAEEIERMVRAYDPWPGTFCLLSTPTYVRGGEGGLKPLRIKILKTSVSKKDYPQKNPGDLFAADKKLAAKCGQGILILDQVQPEGKRPMSGEEFIRGYLR